MKLLGFQQEIETVDKTHEPMNRYYIYIYTYVYIW